MMQDTESSSLTTYSFGQASALMQAGWEAYKLQQFGQSSMLYERALHIAEALDWTEGIVYCRSAGARSLDDSEQPRQALAMLAPLLQMEPPITRQGDYFLALMTYVSVALDIPVSLTTIEAAYTRIEEFLHDCGQAGWRSKLLRSRAQLYDLRGLEAEALRLAQESWACWQDNGVNDIAEAHLNTLVGLSRQLDELEQARRYLEEWERLPDVRPRYRARVFSVAQSLLARKERRLDDALEWARRAMVVAEQMDQPGLSAGGSLIRAYLCLGEAKRARPILARILTLRRSQSILTRYSVQRLRGDFHLASAREAAGMPPADDNMDDTVPIPGRIARQAQVRSALACAHRAYTIGLREGSIIDEKLECSFRGNGVIKRLERVAEIAQHLGE